MKKVFIPVQIDLYPIADELLLSASTGGFDGEDDDFDFDF